MARTKKVRVCVEAGCERPAQTKDDHRDGGWSPYWCKQHDEERIERISKNLERIAEEWPDGK